MDINKTHPNRADIPDLNNTEQMQSAFSELKCPSGMYSDTLGNLTFDNFKNWVDLYPSLGAHFTISFRQYVAYMEGNCDAAPSIDESRIQHDFKTNLGEEDSGNRPRTNPENTGVSPANRALLDIRNNDAGGRLDTNNGNARHELYAQRLEAQNVAAVVVSSNTEVRGNKHAEKAAESGRKSSDQLHATHTETGSGITLAAGS